MSTASMAEHIRSVFQRYVELVTGGDFEAVMLLYAEDATAEDPVGSAPHFPTPGFPGGHPDIRAATGCRGILRRRGAAPGAVSRSG